MTAIMYGTKYDTLGKKYRQATGDASEIIRASWDAESASTVVFLPKTEAFAAGDTVEITNDNISFTGVVQKRWTNTESGYSGMLLDKGVDHTGGETITGGSIIAVAPRVASAASKSNLIKYALWAVGLVTIFLIAKKLLKKKVKA